jgi:molecular chaperone GrpE (heat shock protein)
LNKKHKEEQPITEDKQPVQAVEMEMLKNQLLRALADFDNFRKRAAIEKEEIAKFSNESLIKELLIVVDGFDKAMNFAKTDKEDFIKGIALIKKQLEDTLAKFGVSEVEALDKKYDPHFHEAILMKDSEKENGTIIEVMQKGYVLNGRLIRPSMVIVSKGGKVNE